MSRDVPAGSVSGSSGDLPYAVVDVVRRSLVCFRCSETLATVPCVADGSIADPVLDARRSLIGSAWQIVDPEVLDALSDPLDQPFFERMRPLEERATAIASRSTDPSQILVVCPDCRHVQTIPSRVQR
jgi:hypothetical protein